MKLSSFAISLAIGLAGSVASAQQPLVMEKYTVRDPMINNKEAVSFLKPQGWQVSGGVKWYHELAHLTCLEVKIFNPNGLEQIESFPWTNLCWFTNPVIPMNEGYNYMGQIVMRPIEDPREVIQRMTIPTIRKGARIVGSQEMPELAKTLSAQNGGARTRSTRVRIEYTVNGRPVEEDIYLSIYVTSANIASGNTAYIWGPAWTPFALRAPKGQLDAATPMLLSIATSARMHQGWFSDYSYVCKLFTDRHWQSIADAKRLSDIITANSNYIFNMYSDAYWKRQATQSRLSQQFSNYIRGVEQYNSPYSNHPVSLPSGYNYVWAGSNGQYVLSNNAGYNPNVGGTTNWTLLKTAQ